MKLGVYNIINDPLPQLNKLKDINVTQKDFEYDEDIVNMLNKQLKIDKLDSEHIYVLALTYGLIPRGIIQVSVGKCDYCQADYRTLGIGLLLTGAEQFMCFHNHPGGDRNVSMQDRILTEKYQEVGDILGIHFIRHLMITQDYFCVCEEV